MTYYGSYQLFFSSFDSVSMSQTYQAQFEVDVNACELPGSILRRIAFQMFEQSNATGISIEGYRISREEHK